MKNNDLARKIDSMRQFGYVLLTPKEGKRVAIELRRVERLKKLHKYFDDHKNDGWCRSLMDAAKSYAKASQ